MTVNKIREIFPPFVHILSGRPNGEEASTVNDTHNSEYDLDDWIFQDEEYQPSQR